MSDFKEYFVITSYSIHYTKLYDSKKSKKAAAVKEAAKAAKAADAAIDADDDFEEFAPVDE